MKGIELIRAIEDAGNVLMKDGIAIVDGYVLVGTNRSYTALQSPSEILRYEGFDDAEITEILDEFGEIAGEAMFTELVPNMR